MGGIHESDRLLEGVVHEGFRVLFFLVETLSVLTFLFVPLFAFFFFALLVEVLEVARDPFPNKCDGSRCGTRCSLRSERGLCTS